MKVLRRMKLHLPNGDIVELDLKLPLEQKKQIVDGILKEWNDYFIEHFNSMQVRICLDKIGTYLSRDGSPTDNEVISRTKFRKMIRGHDREIHFDNLSFDVKKLLGINIEEE